MATTTRARGSQATGEQGRDAALRRVVATCPLFQGAPADSWEEVLRDLDVRERSYDTGELLVRIGERLPRFGVVVEGRVVIEFYDEEGNASTVARMGRSGSFAEAIAFSGLPSIVQVSAQEPTRVLWLEVARLTSHAALAQSRWASLVMGNAVEALARKNLMVNRKMQVVAQKRLRDRIKLYLAIREAAGAEGVEWDMGRTELAHYLSVDRSALSRELGRMRDEGLVRLDGNRIQVLDRSFLEG